MTRNQWLLTMGIAFLFLPFLSTLTFPSQDGPAHLDTARLITLLDRDAPTASSIYVRADPGISNALAPWLLSLIASISEPTAAEWGLNLLLTVLMFLAIMLPLYLLHASAVWGLVGLPLAIPYMQYMGSISLCLSYAFIYSGLAIGAAYLRRPSGLLLILFTIVGLMAFLVQAQSAIAILAASLGGVAGATIWRALRGGLLEASRRLLFLAAASMPVVVALLIYQATFSREILKHDAQWSLFLTSYDILARREIAQFSLLDRVLHMMMFGCLLALALSWIWKRYHDETKDVSSDWLFAGSVASFVVLLILPYGTSAIPSIPQRMLPVSHFMLYLWLVSTSPNVLWRGVVIWLAASIMVITGASRTVAHVRLAGYIEDITRLEESIPERSVVLPFDVNAIMGSHVLVRQGGLNFGFRPWLHRGRGYGVRDIASLGNYQALPHYPYFRIRYQPRWFSSPDALEPNAAALSEFTLSAWLDRFEATFERRVTHVVLTTEGIDPYVAASSNTGVKAVLNLLHDRFDPVQSSHGGAAILWARRKS